jgi:YVTN family beta-propeller protein
MKLSSLPLIAAVIFATTHKIAFAQTSGYHVVNTLHISGAGRWDYIALNPVNDNVYVSHMTQVNILNRNTGDSVGIIPNTDGIHGIAFAPELKKGFTSNGKLNTVSVFDINTNAVLAQIKTGENPDAIMYDPHSRKVYVCNGRSKDLTIIDPADNSVLRTVALGGKPETAVSGLNDKIYINIEDKNEIVVVNTKTYTIEKHWHVGKGDEPSGLAIDTKTKRLFVGCGNKLLIVLNMENGKVIKELHIGDGCDGVDIDPSLGYVFSSNGDGTLTVIHEKTANDISVIDNVTTKKSARTLVVDGKAHKVYLPAADLEPADPKEPKHRPNAVPGSFQVMVVGK